MAIPVVGDGEYIGAGNTNETLYVGKSTQPVMVGAASTATVGFYGTTPVVRRTFVASLHNTTAIAASASFGASQLAVVNELQNTMRALGIWATA